DGPDHGPGEAHPSPGPAGQRLQGASASRPCGFAALRPMAVAIRLIVATRLSSSGPRMAFWTKFGPPWPTVVCRRLLASAIWVFSRSRLRVTSAWAWAGMAGSLLATSGQVIWPTAAWLLDAALAAPGSPKVVAIASAPPAIARASAPVAIFVRRDRRCRPPVAGMNDSVFVR